MPRTICTLPPARYNSNMTVEITTCHVGLSIGASIGVSIGGAVESARGAKEK